MADAVLTFILNTRGQIPPRMHLLAAGFVRLLQSRSWVAGAVLACLATNLTAAEESAANNRPPHAASASDARLEHIETQALSDWSEGRYALAIEHWQELIAAAPTRQRYRIGLVRTLVSAGDIDGARATLQDAKAIPGEGRSDEYNLLMAEGEVLRAESRDRASDRAFDAAAALAGREMTRRASRPSRPAHQKRWRLNSGALYEHFDNQRGDEHQLFAQLSYRYSRDVLLFAAYERHHRFDALDQVYLGGAAFRLGERLVLNANLGGSPEASFRPRTEASIRLDWLASARFRPLVGYQVLDYREGNITTVTPGLRLLLGLVDIELQYALTDELNGASTRIGGISFDWPVTPRWLASLNYYRGTEALPPQQRARFQRIGASMIWLPTARWSVRGDLAYEDREQLYTARSVGLSLGYSF